MTELHTKVISHNQEIKRKLANAIADRYRNDCLVDDHFKNADIKMAPWISERSDNYKLVKYKGQPYWSKAAIEHYRNNGVKGLRHEHAVPRKLIIKLLEECDKSQEAIYSILENLVHAVIVTKEEAAILDQKFKASTPQEIKISNEINNVFSRYIAMNMKVYYLENGNPKVDKIQVDILSSIK
jgi:hypothetical protein